MDETIIRGEKNRSHLIVHCSIPWTPENHYPQVGAYWFPFPVLNCQVTILKCRTDCIFLEPKPKGYVVVTPVLSKNSTNDQSHFENRLIWTVIFRHYLQQNNYFKPRPWNIVRSCSCSCRGINISSASCSHVEGNRYVWSWIDSNGKTCGPVLIFPNDDTTCIDCRIGFTFNIACMSIDCTCISVFIVIESDPDWIHLILNSAGFWRILKMRHWDKHIRCSMVPRKLMGENSVFDLYLLHCFNSNSGDYLIVPPLYSTVLEDRANIHAASRIYRSIAGIIIKSVCVGCFVCTWSI